MKRAAVTLVTLAMLGCAPSEPPKAPEPQPLVIGTSPPAPIAIDPKSVRTEPSPLAESTGSAPRVSLDSLTTPGKVFIPAGKVVIVHFWATWCTPCMKSLPALEALYTKLRARGLEVIAVSVDDKKEGLTDFVKRHGVTFPVGWDEAHKITEGYEVQSMPSTYVIDRRGTIVNTHAGYHDGEERELEREISSLL